MILIGAALFFTFQFSPVFALFLSLIVITKLIVTVQKSQHAYHDIYKQIDNLQNRDILNQKTLAQKNAELEEKYFIHNLTSLPNKNALIHHLHSDKNYTLLLINIDAFKEINEFYGFNAGDSLINQLATHLLETPVMFEHTLYHIFADEFAFLFSQKLSKEELRLIIKDIEKLTQKQAFYASMKEQILFSLSFGISYSDEEAFNNDTLITQANLALSQAKEHGEHWRIYDASCVKNNNYEENIYWFKKLKEAILENRIEPYFQPIVDYPSMRIRSQEALIRLIEKTGVPIVPYYFLDIAKKSKLYPSLTKIMIEKTFTKFANSSMHFSINFSYQDMQDNEILTLLREKLQNSNIGERFTAEILESESIKNYDHVKNFIDTIKTYGAKVAIDDFGSGYSNFERLFKLDIDYVKIDGSIIKDIDENQQLFIIAETIVNFAKKSDIKVIAEYVHSKEIADILAKMGIEEMQGYYFAEPSPNIEPSLEHESKVMA